MLPQKHYKLFSILLIYFIVRFTISHNTIATPQTTDSFSFASPWWSRIQEDEDGKEVVEYAASGAMCSLLTLSQDYCLSISPSYPPASATTPTPARLIATRAPATLMDPFLISFTGEHMVGQSGGETYLPVQVSSHPSLCSPGRGGTLWFRLLGRYRERTQKMERRNWFYVTFNSLAHIAMRNFQGAFQLQKHHWQPSQQTLHIYIATRPTRLWGSCENSNLRPHTWELGIVIFEFIISKADKFISLRSYISKGNSF